MSMLCLAVEAVHLANLLCQFGYYFPVNEQKNLLVKDDSSLYRFQVKRRLLLYLQDLHNCNNYSVFCTYSPYYCHFNCTIFPFLEPVLLAVAAPHAGQHRVRHLPVQAGTAPSQHTRAWTRTPGNETYIIRSYRATGCLIILDRIITRIIKRHLNSKLFARLSPILCNWAFKLKYKT